MRNNVKEFEVKTGNQQDCQGLEIDMTKPIQLHAALDTLCETCGNLIARGDECFLSDCGGGLVCAKCQGKGAGVVSQPTKEEANDIADAKTAEFAIRFSTNEWAKKLAHAKTVAEFKKLLQENRDYHKRP